MRSKAVVAILSLAFLLAGCSPLENHARDAAAAAQGFIQQAQKNHQAECQAFPTKPWPCVAINEAVGAQNLLIDAVEQYCGWPSGVAAPTQPCLRKAEYQKRLAAAVDSVNRIIKDYRAAAQ